jgi:hypothetical protein
MNLHSPIRFGRPIPWLAASLIALSVLLGISWRKARFRFPPESEPEAIPAVSLSTGPTQSFPPTGTAMATSLAKPILPSPKPSAPNDWVATTRPWWASLPSTEIEARRKDFAQMYAAPGGYPEFSELVRSLRDAAVPPDVVEMEAREIYGALLQRTHYGGIMADEAALARAEADEGMRMAFQLSVDFYRQKTLAAEVELQQRLTNVGLAMDSGLAQRILQLQPRNPLWPLTTDTRTESVQSSTPTPQVLTTP